MFNMYILWGGENLPGDYSSGKVRGILARPLLLGIFGNFLFGSVFDRSKWDYALIKREMLHNIYVSIRKIIIRINK